MWGGHIYFRNPLATFQQLQRKDKAHFIPPSLVICEYHWRSLMICATGSYSILLVSLENASKVGHTVLQDTALNQSSKSSTQQNRSAVSGRLRPGRTIQPPSLNSCNYETLHFSLNPTSSPGALKTCQRMFVPQWNACVTWTALMV